MKATVLFSGGIDSTTVLALAIEKAGRENVTALSVRYGQKHEAELSAAAAIAAHYGVEQLVTDLTTVFSTVRRLCSSTRLRTYRRKVMRLSWRR